jgi:hypothetical protein
MTAHRSCVSAVARPVRVVTRFDAFSNLVTKGNVAIVEISNKRLRYVSRRHLLKEIAVPYSPRENRHFYIDGQELNTMPMNISMADA